MSIFSLLLYIVYTAFYCHTRRVDNICSTQHLKRVFLGSGESGVLQAYNITHVASNVTFQEGCQVEIITCSSCIFSLTFRLMNLSCYCSSAFNLFLFNPCRCDYVWVTEPPYETSGVAFCRGPGFEGKDLEYKSKTRTVRVSLFYSRAHVHAFTLEYKSEPNRALIFGASHPAFEPNLSTGFISSPFFPAVYPRDFISEYVLTCVNHGNLSSDSNVPLRDDSNCRVHLLFTDFQLATSSIMEFYDGSRRVNVVSGTSFRPPVIISTTNSLTIRFYASGQNSMGFKAAFSFLSENALKDMPKTSTDCGGYVDNYGGTITMMKMVGSHLKLFDCIWLIKPLENFFSLKTHLYLKVTTFLDFAGDAELQVRQGLTSESPILESFRYPVSQNFQEHVIPFKSGYYVSLRALFGPASHFAVTYASFSHNKCFILTEFLCRNFRCISKKLTCDGFDHCGDNSDEPALCFREWGLEPGVGRWYTRTSNYYFPKIRAYSDLKTASIIFLVCLVGLVFFISALTTVLYRIGSKARRQTELQNQVQSVSDIRDYLSDEISIEDIVIDEPPSYESPPNYEEVVKMPTNRCATLDKRCPNSSRLDQASDGSCAGQEDCLDSYCRLKPLVTDGKSFSMPSLSISVPPEVSLSCIGLQLDFASFSSHRTFKDVVGTSPSVSKLNSGSPVMELQKFD